MGIFDQVVGSLLGGSGGGSPIQGALMSLLSGGRGGADQAAAGQGTVGQGGMPMQGFGAGSAGAAGGLGGLVAAFEQAGMGNVVQSWIGNGQNMAVSPQQLRGVLGDDHVQSLASQSGMPQEDFLSQLSQHLPNAVNGVTPNGRLPDEGTVSV